jgi:hypothetical protein
MQGARAGKPLEGELDRWWRWSICRVRHLVLHARDKKMRHSGSVVERAIFMAVGLIFRRGPVGSKPECVTERGRDASEGQHRAAPGAEHAQG